MTWIIVFFSFLFLLLLVLLLFFSFWTQQQILQIGGISNNEENVYLFPLLCSCLLKLLVVLSLMTLSCLMGLVYRNNASPRNSLLLVVLMLVLVLPLSMSVLLLILMNVQNTKSNIFTELYNFSFSQFWKRKWISWSTVGWKTIFFLFY